MSDIVALNFANCSPELNERLAKAIIQYIKDLYSKNHELEQEIQLLQSELESRLQVPRRARDGKFLPAKRRT